MLKRQLVQTAAFSSAILVVVVLIDYLVNGVWLPGDAQYTPVTTILIVCLVAPPSSFFLIRQNARFHRVQRALAIEKEARLVEVERALALAESATRAKSEFLANMSHEIRTPMNGVLGMAQSLDSDDLTADQREKVAIILESGKSLLTLLNDVLDLSKIEAGKLEITPAPGDFLHTMKRTRQLFQVQAEDKGLELLVRHEADFPPRLIYDALRVRQCLSNLLSNAVKFTSHGRVEVALSTKAEGGGGASSVSRSPTPVSESAPRRRRNSSPPSPRPTAPPLAATAAPVSASRSRASSRA